jgi:alkylation response protein AidB-like acyl-CoA dehydrogenase
MTTALGLDELLAQLAEDAARLERDGVTRADVRRMADAGLLGVYGPDGLPAAEQREVAERLAGASPDAWFVWYQHGPVVKFLAASDNAPLQDAHLADLCAGRSLGGVAFSNLRTARPSVSATRVDGGWSLSGPQPWCTGWGMHDLLLVGGKSDETGEVVFGVVPSDRSGLTSRGELALASMGGTSTHAVRFDDVLVRDDEVVLRKDFGAWADADAVMNRNVQPSTFGIALAALELLEPASASTAAALRDRVLDVRTRAYLLLDEHDPADAGDERLALRASALLLGLECCTALLASQGGRGMGLDDPAQRLLRAAAFQLVHSQAAHIRGATLAALAR